MSQAIRGLGAEGDCCRGMMVRQALSEAASRVCVHMLTTQAHTETQQVLRHTDTYSHTQPRPRYSPEAHSGRRRISYPHRLTCRDTQPMTELLPTKLWMCTRWGLGGDEPETLQPETLACPCQPPLVPHPTHPSKGVMLLLLFSQHLLPPWDWNSEALACVGRRT